MRRYDTFWMAEHHFQPEHTELIPNLLMMATHLCGVDYAMADILTGGRVIFGVGRGYHTREVETLGSPLIDQYANREMFEEGVGVLFQAFERKPFLHQIPAFRDTRTAAAAQ